jgi:glycosyltransferase involved in cell wall biosynthesis
MPVYNGARYVAAAIESVLNQTFRSFELLVMDDGSTDETPAILARFAANDHRVRVLLRPRRGQIATRNELLHLAQTEIVACADADDICLPARFERQMSAMAQCNDLWVLGTAMIAIDANGRRHNPRRVITGSTAVASELERGCCIGHPSVMMHRERILAIGGYRTAYEAAEDYDLFLRASERGKVDNLPEPGVLYREHEESVSHRHALRQSISADLARATHRLRIAGETDPTVELAAPPDLEAPMMIALIPPAQLERHRACSVTTDPQAGMEDVDWALRYFLSAPMSRKQARATQRAIVRLLVRRRPDSSSIRAITRAIMLGPGRFVRLLLFPPGGAFGATASRNHNAEARVVGRAI